jgi:regulator of PEP synthase PpsR (kinase-PPPase family)
MIKVGLKTSKRKILIFRDERLLITAISSQGTRTYIKAQGTELKRVTNICIQSKLRTEGNDHYNLSGAAS